MEHDKRPRPRGARSATPAPLGLQRRCACGGVATADGECAACRSQRLSAQREAGKVLPHGTAPPAVRDVLRTPGEALDASTRSVMEARFGHDFRHVRIHRGTRASETARAVGASAYTVGAHIVFGRGQYAPGLTAGRSLLAHELAHVRQQAGSAGTWDLPATIPVLPAGTSQEGQAEVAARAAASGSRGLSGHDARLSTEQPVGLARQGAPQPNPDFWLNLQISGSGRVQVTVSGPSLPVVGNPTLGLRRDPGGSYQMVFGNKDKVLAPSEVPDLLRGALGKSGRPGAPAPPIVLRTPSCTALRAPSGGRFMTYDEYRISQMLSPTLLPMTPPIYEARVAACTAAEAEPPAEPQQPPAPAPAPTPAATPVAAPAAGGEPSNP